MVLRAAESRPGRLKPGVAAASRLKLLVGHTEPVVRGHVLLVGRALAQDRAGRIWVGTDDGLVFVREHEQFTPVALPEAIQGEPIRFIVPDEHDTV